MRRMKPRFGYADVMSTVCFVLLVLGLAGGGAAFAHGKIGSSDIKSSAVKTRHLYKGSVGAGKIRPGAVTTGKLRDHSVTGAKLAPNALRGPEFADHAAGVAQAGVTVAPDGTAGGWFNRLGGKPQVTRTEAGRYQVRIPGLRVAPAVDIYRSLIISVSSTAGRDANCYWAGHDYARSALEVVCLAPNRVGRTDSHWNLVLHAS